MGAKIDVIKKAANSKAGKKIQSALGINFDDAKTKTGAISKGRIRNKAGDTSHLMGSAVIDTQGKRDKLAGGTAGLALGTALSNLDKLPKGKKGSQSDRKESRTGSKPGTTAAQKKKEAKAERNSAFKKAFSKARAAGQSTFTFRDEGEFNTDIKTDNPKKVSRVVKKKMGGMMKKKGYAKGGAVSRKPRGVGAATRGYGRAMR
tara:strand:+ start:229 stop:840 length:612 start_codon:yes stop_codon:yes gene_type:complete